MKEKRWLIVGICLPAVVLIGWFIYQQVSIWATARPRWLTSAAGRYCSSCQCAAQLDTYDGELVEDVQAALVARERARTIAGRVLARRYGFPLIVYVSGPDLARVSLPGDGERLVWTYAAVIDPGGATLMGQGAAVYVDALTGEPLVLITDIVVGDPAMACGLDLSLAPTVGRVLALVLLAIYGVLVLLCLGAVRAWRWAQRRSRGE